MIEEYSEIKVVPVYLANMGRSLPKGEYLPLLFFCEIMVDKPLVLHGQRTKFTNKLEERAKELKLHYKQYYL